MRLFFDHSYAESDRIRSFYFKPEHAFNFTAGQYMEITLPHDKPDKRGQKRFFTISSSPTQELVSITTRISKEQGSSFKKALNSLKPGTEVFMTGPMGDFVLPKLIQTPLIFVAGGIGITPFHSILTWLHDSHEQRPIKVLYAVKNEDDIIFSETFTRVSQHVMHIVDDPSPSWGGVQGRLNGEMVIGLSEPGPDSLLYLSGPEPMVETLGKDLIKRGIKKPQIVQDFFPNYEDY